MKRSEQGGNREHFWDRKRCFSWTGKQCIRWCRKKQHKEVRRRAAKEETRSGRAAESRAGQPAARAIQGTAKKITKAEEQQVGAVRASGGRKR